MSCNKDIRQNYAEITNSLKNIRNSSCGGKEIQTEFAVLKKKFKGKPLAIFMFVLYNMLTVSF